MPIIVEWLADKRACFVTLPDIFDDDELRNHETVMVNWLDEGEENKYIIADVSAMKKVPSLKQAMMLKHMRHTRLTQGVTVGLSLNPVARFVVSLVTQASGLQHKNFNTREEAVAYVMESLPV